MQPTLTSPDLRPPVVRRQGVLRRRRITRTTLSARSCTSPGRSPTARSAAGQGMPVSSRRGARAGRSARQRDAARRRDAGATRCSSHEGRGDAVHRVAPPAAGGGHRRGSESGASSALKRLAPPVRVRPPWSAQLPKPAEAVAALTSRREVGDQFFSRGRVAAKVGQRLTWRFTGVEPHSVTVANGPRGFWSNYLGQTCAESY